VRSSGGSPFIIPARGSHGGATPEDQNEILRRLAVTDQATGVPVRATMEARALGESENSAIAHVDRLAFEAMALSFWAGRRRTRNQPPNSHRVY
jgi:hypothetical protein